MEVIHETQIVYHIITRPITTLYPITTEIIRYIDVLLREIRVCTYV